VGKDTSVGVRGTGGSEIEYRQDGIPFSEEVRTGLSLTAFDEDEGVKQSLNLSGPYDRVEHQHPARRPAKTRHLQL